jgi:hypothetical protein
MPTWHAVGVTISPSSPPVGRSPSPIGGVPHWRVVPGIATVTTTSSSSRSALDLFSLSYLLLWNSLLDLDITILKLNETHTMKSITGIFMSFTIQEFAFYGTVFRIRTRIISLVSTVNLWFMILCDAVYMAYWLPWISWRPCSHQNTIHSTCAKSFM